jgi:uncharacterized protein YcnI
MNKGIRAFLLNVVGLFLFAAPAFAHVIVTPHQVGIAATQDFTVSVPNERNDPVVALRLVMPKGLSDVSPNTTPGWKISVKSKGKGDNATVSEIDWSKGSIPVGQREEFIFQAQVPPSPTTLDWKAYQTYSDGTVVAWDVDPAKFANMTDAQQDAMADKQNKGEYSTTNVVNDLTSSDTSADSANAVAQNVQFAEIFSGVAILIALFSFALSLRKKGNA